LSRGEADTLEQALKVVAYLVVRHGDAYLPLLDRLEREWELELSRGTDRARAQEILSKLTREVRNAQGA
jgi:hypothetical protein